MSVYEAGQQGQAGEVDHLRLRRNGNHSPGSRGEDHIAVQQDHRVVKDWAAGAVNQSRACQRFHINLPPCWREPESSGSMLDRAAPSVKDAKTVNKRRRVCGNPNVGAGYNCRRRRCEET